MDSLLIQRGRVIDPASGIDQEMDVLLRDGRVAAVAAPGKLRGQATEPSTRAAASSLPASSICTCICASPASRTRRPSPPAPRRRRRADSPPSARCPTPSPVNDSPEITRWMQAPRARRAGECLSHRRRDRGQRGREADELRRAQERRRGRRQRRRQAHPRRPPHARGPAAPPRA